MQEHSPGDQGNNPTVHEAGLAAFGSARRAPTPVPVAPSNTSNAVVHANPTSRSRGTRAYRVSLAARFATIVAVGAFFSGCGDSSESTTKQAKETKATKEIGALGGVLEVGDLILSIPPGALKESTSITVERLSEIPSEYGAWMRAGTPLYRFSPSQLRFEKDVEVRVAASSSPADIGALWTDNSGLNFVDFVYDGSGIIAHANHFSTFGFLSWEHVKASAWELAKITVDGAGLVVDSLNLLGTVEMALLCKASGYGNVNQKPCQGPKLDGGKYEPLCFGPAFASGKILLLNPETGLCQEAEPASMSGMTAAHNAVRASVQPAADPPLPPLAWSSDLAATAQAWADNCDFQHSSSAFGENLYASSGSSPNPSSVVDNWASEASAYDYVSNSCSGECGHYTQVVWRNTTALGCGSAICTTSSPFGGSEPWQLWVCNYDPPGNFIDQEPY